MIRRKTPATDSAWQLFWLYEMAMLLERGLALPECLTIVASSRPRYAREQQKVAASVQGGAQLSAALKQTPLLPLQSVALIEAAERANQLPKMLFLLHEEGVAREGHRHDVRKLLTYPAILLVVVSISLGFAISWLMPQLFILQHQPDALNAASRLLIFIAGWPSMVWWALGGMLAVIAGVLIAFRHHAAIQAIWLSLPLWSEWLRLRELCVMTQYVSNALAAKVPLLEALSLAIPLLRYHRHRQALTRMVGRMMNGEPLAEALHTTAFFPPLARALISKAVGQHQQQACWQRLAAHYAREQQFIAERIKPLIEPTLTLMVGLLLAFMVYALILPLYNAV